MSFNRTRYQTILSNFKGATTGAFGLTWEVTDISPSSSSPLSAEEINYLRKIVYERTSARSAGSSELSEELEKRLKQLGEVVKGDARALSRLEPIIPGSAEAALYPLLFRCTNPNCGALYLFTYQTLPLDEPKCKLCGGDLTQEQVIFVCPVCGERKIPVPDKYNVDENSGLLYDEKGRPIRFLKDVASLSNSKWKYGDEEERPVQKYCYCGQAGEKPKRMQLKPATQTYYRAEVVTAVRCGRYELSKTSLEQIVRDRELVREASGEELDKVKAWRRFDNVYRIGQVTRILATYGYRPLDARGKVRFFTRAHGKQAFYVTKDSGTGMVITLNKEKLLGAIADDVKPPTKADYESAINDPKTAAAAFRLLHSVLHSLMYQAPLEAGVEPAAVEGKVWLKECAVILYEAGSKGSGWVDYILNHRFLNWVSNAIVHVLECRYNCEDGCIGCLFLRDQLCHPFIEENVERVVIGERFKPNELLSRRLFLKFWGAL